LRLVLWYNVLKYFEKIVPMQSILDFFNTYFERLIAIDAFFLIGAIVIYLAARLRDVSLKAVINQTLYYCLLFCQSALFTLTFIVLFYNLSQIRPLNFTEQILSTTSWVKDKTEIFFIVDRKLVSIKANGDARAVVFSAPDNIKQYVFSPNGHYILIITENNLYLHDKRHQDTHLIDSVSLPDLSRNDIRGNIDSISWGPLSRKFYYRISKWSRVSSLDQYNVYHIKQQKKSLIQSPSLALARLLWDRKGTSLYYLKVKTIHPDDELTTAQPVYETIVYEISLDVLTPQKVLQVMSDEPGVPFGQLAVKGIHLYWPKYDLSFGHTGSKRIMARSSFGREIGINDQDVLYYVHGIWWRKRLFQIPRFPDAENPLMYQHQGGRLSIGDLRFLSSGRYVVMEHFLYGILILDPLTSKVGILDNQRGNTFGWYSG